MQNLSPSIQALSHPCRTYSNPLQALSLYTYTFSHFMMNLSRPCPIYAELSRVSLVPFKQNFPTKFMSIANVLIETCVEQEGHPGRFPIQPLPPSGIFYIYLHYIHYSNVFKQTKRNVWILQEDLKPNEHRWTH